MKVTIAQINTTNGDIAGNTSKVIAAIEKARYDGSDLVVFPEVVTHGYTSQDWFQDADIISSALDPLESIIAATRGITAVVGTIRPNDEKDGRRLYNAAAVIHDGRLLGFADKTLLPEYDVFDDPRYFEPSDHRRIFEVNGVKLGVVVCEDFWNDKTFWKERLYESDPTDEVIGIGADIIVSVNASPYNKGKIKLRCDMVAHRAKLQKKPIVFVNLVGGNDGIIFDGASLIADQEGDIILQAAAFEEFVETVELDSALQAEYETRRGVLRLLLLAFAQQVRFARKHFADRHDLTLLASVALPEVRIADRLAERVILEAFLPEEQATPQTRAEFDALAVAGRDRFQATLARIEARAREILGELKVVRQKLRALATPVCKAAVADIEQQLAGLFPADFLLRIPPSRLTHYPRYLKAIVRRLDRLPAGAARDAELLRAIEPFIRECQGLRVAAGGPERAALLPELAMLRFMIEEFRVSQYAQDLRTAVPVSPPRMTAQVEKARVESTRHD